MTFIVIPHGGGDLSTRSFEVSYRRLRAVGLLLIAAALLWIGMAASWGWMAGQVARIPGMRQETAQLEAERRRMVQLSEQLARVERQWDQVRAMLGAAGTPADSAGLALPAPDTLAPGADPAPPPP